MVAKVSFACNKSRKRSLRALRLRANSYKRLGLWYQMLHDLTEIINSQKMASDCLHSGERNTRPPSFLHCYIIRAEAFAATGALSQAGSDLNEVLHALDHSGADCSIDSDLLVLRAEALMRRAELVELALASTSGAEETYGDGNITCLNALADYDGAVAISTLLRNSQAAPHRDTGRSKLSRSSLGWRPIYRRARCLEILGRLEDAASDFHEAGTC